MNGYRVALDDDNFADIQADKHQVSTDRTLTFFALAPGSNAGYRVVSLFLPGSWKYFLMLDAPDNAYDTRITYNNYPQDAN